MFLLRRVSFGLRKKKCWIVNIERLFFVCGFCCCCCCWEKMLDCIFFCLCVWLSLSLSLSLFLDQFADWKVFDAFVRDKTGSEINIRMREKIYFFVDAVLHQKYSEKNLGIFEPFRRNRSYIFYYDLKEYKRYFLFL